MRTAQRDDATGRAALARLLEDFTVPATAVIRRTLGRHAVDDRVADVLQTAALRFIATGLKAYSGQAAPRTYFLRIAINAAVDALRAGERPGAATGEQLDEARMSAPAPDAETSLGDLQQHLALREALGHCLDRLAASYREAVDLYYLEPRGGCARCAELAGISATAFMQRLSRARAQLGACLQRWRARPLRR